MNTNPHRNTPRSSPAYFLGRSAGTWRTALQRPRAAVPARR
jgi:hypothetical protein